MLQTATTSDELFSVLKDLMKVPSLESFRLVGGTALSLQLGHRISEDIDLFASEDDDAILGLQNIENNTGLHLHIGSSKQESIKTDILNWTISAWLDPVKEIDGIRFATIEEIAWMKLEVVARRKKKRFLGFIRNIRANSSFRIACTVFAQIPIS